MRVRPGTARKPLGTARAGELTDSLPDDDATAQVKQFEDQYDHADAADKVTMKKMVYCESLRRAMLALGDASDGLDCQPTKKGIRLVH